MAQKRKSAPSKEKIAAYWIKNAPYCETELNFDWADAVDVCWNCGAKETARTQRCHIVPHSLGGSSDPSNMVLLCPSCHKEAPDVDSPSYLWEWIKSNYVPGLLYDTYKTRKAFEIYEKKYGNFVCDELLSYLKKEDHINLGDLFRDINKKIWNNVSTHSGGVSISTIVWILHETKKEMICYIYNNIY